MNLIVPHTTRTTPGASDAAMAAPLFRKKRKRKRREKKRGKGKREKGKRKK